MDHYLSMSFKIIYNFEVLTKPFILFFISIHFSGSEMVFIVQNRLRAQNICHPSLTKGELLGACGADQRVTEIERWSSRTTDPN